MDYEGLDVENDEVRTQRAMRSDKLLRKLGMRLATVRHAPSENRDDLQDSERGREKESDDKFSSDEYTKNAQDSHRRVAFTTDDVTIVTSNPVTRDCSPARTAVPSRVTSPAPTVTVTHVDRDRHPHEINSSVHVPPPPQTLGSPSVPPESASLTRRIISRVLPSLKSLITPPALAIIFAFPIALITPLKALFTPLPPGSGPSPIPNAPDGQPPLAFILDTANFIGAASVPLGLVCLGSALARLKLPPWRTWFGKESELPVGAIIGLAIGKMIVMPIVGVAMVQGMVQVGFIDRNDKVLRFVCM
jgi:hypothetical protein